MIVLSSIVLLQVSNLLKYFLLSIPMSSLSLSSIKDITNLASVSIANIDLLTSKQGQQPSQALSQVHI